MVVVPLVRLPKKTKTKPAKPKPRLATPIGEITREIGKTQGARTELSAPSALSKQACRNPARWEF